ncbi:membrane protein YpdK [Lonsdalea populi]|uniref:Membrane protein YpdK n=1 Tax=Lonsdalea populi TaxID=1172565 RepID=A0A3N0UNF7_9GAMM|nr:membrane protein YpdK [Lonsdalea populi]ROH83482.1 membrane protein YpdK [Lonsdalea populi]ROH83767.1 membrane protein YpdK [Lonsdalea populi]
MKYFFIAVLFTLVLWIGIFMLMVN